MEKRKNSIDLDWSNTARGEGEIDRKGLSLGRQSGLCVFVLRGEDTSHTIRAKGGSEANDRRESGNRKWRAANWTLFIDCLFNL